MYGTWNGVLWSAVLLLGAMPGGDAEPPTLGRTIILTPQSIEKDVSVRIGDEVILKLPAQLPLWWVTTSRIAGLSQIGVPTWEDMKDADPNVLGRPKWYLVRYRIVEGFVDTKVEWMYCYLGKTTEKGAPVKPEGLLKPGEIPTKKGTVFFVKLRLDG